MPDPILTPALISAGGNLLGQAGNIMSQGSMNRKTRAWNEKMYGVQRQDALADWTMQNEYNSPQAQMQRYRDAGLNPNLIYGNGSAAGGSAGDVRSTNVAAWHPDAPTVNMGGITGSLMAYYDIQMKEAQVDNLKVQNTVATQEALLKAAQTLQISSGTERTQFDTQMAKELRNNTIETAQAQLRRINADTEYSLDNNERQAASNAAGLAEAAERILTLRLGRAKTSDEQAEIRARITNLHRDAELKRLDIELKRLGIMPSDNIAARMLARIVGKSDMRPITADDWKATRQSPGWLDSMKVPRKSGYQLFLERKNK